MKLFLIMLVVMICIFYLMSVIQVTYWLRIVLLLLPPLLLIIFCLGAGRYNVRPGLKLLKIPEKGYESRIRAVQDIEQTIRNFGFAKIDEVYIRTLPVCLIYTYKHDTEPVYYFINHYGPGGISYKLVSKFDDEITLMTSASYNDGNFPRRKKFLLQTFQGKKYYDLYTLHLVAMDYMKNNNMRVETLPDDVMLAYFNDSMLKNIERLRKDFFWSLRMIIWTLTDYGKRYARPIEEQYPSGFDHIYIEDKLAANLK
ncbi:MAG: hypothetical protein A2Y62_02250 [Candidatus Fischerbacteria bacterium RBG_13_37_8]|uniref:Uncharacterized protein n=1 Tax=Candidatus Fischerbacteria bacterium RBG_13_37_8 TaxID=1817863 RepID=A0A1F5VWD9_9BACT|nr:MAG: hypothetical protein A2Y62_02250 [Candidatus Fischerbacteria bacterium RBG_13_37_8]